MTASRRSEQSIFLFCCVACLCLLADALDCRIFVFAPRCRGISAKRSTKLNNEDLRELGEVDESWVDSPRSSPDDSNGLTFRNKKGSTQLLQELLEKFQDYANLREDEK